LTKSFACNASSHADLEKVQKLLEMGANVNAKDLYGYRPIHEACQNGHEDIVRVLLKSGADIKAKTAPDPHLIHVKPQKRHELPDFHENTYPPKFQCWTLHSDTWNGGFQSFSTRFSVIRFY
jgi:ankyrin repeat protein